MEVTIDKTHLERLLDRVSAAAHKFPVRLEASEGTMEVVATDLDVTVSCHAPAQVTTAGTVVVGFSGLSDRVKKLAPGDVTLVTGKDGRLAIRSGKARFNITLPDAGAFPGVEFLTSAATVVDAPDLLAALRQVVGAAGTDPARPALTGVLFDAGTDELSVVATDSYRLAVATLPGEGFLAGSALVPAGAIALLVRTARDGQIAVRADERRVSYTASDVTVMGRLLADVFPEYQKLIPASATTRWTSSAAELVGCIRRAEVVLGSSSPAIKLAVGPDTTTVTAASGADDFEETVDGTLDGDPVTFAVNPAFLRIGAQSCTGPEVTLSLTDPMRPISLSGADAGFRYIVMPVRA